MFTLLKKLLSVSVLLGLSAIATADDIDIVESGSLKDANILFIMDLSGSMNWSLTDDDKPDGGDPSRLDVLKDAFQAIVADQDFDETNFGLSVFSGDAIDKDGKDVAHGIAFPVNPLIGKSAQDSLNENSNFTHKGSSYMPAVPSVASPDIYTTREYLSLLSSDPDIWDAGGKTPIVDALYEASLYFRADQVKYGKFPADDVRSAHPSTYSGSLSASSSTVTPACTIDTRVSCTKGVDCGSTYDCPITYENSTRSDPTDGINCTTNTGLTCLTTAASCGLGTNCTPEVNTYNRFCASSISTIAACEAANPNWNSCQSYDYTSCTTNDEGQSVCTASTRVKCKETITQNRCDVADTYTCGFPVEKCTKCPDETTETNITGSAIYTSPIVSECPKNGIILLTDGEPTKNNSAAFVATRIGAYANSCDAGSDHGRCGPELVDFLYNEDQADGSTVGVNNIAGIQNVATYPIGLALDSDAANYLQSIADKGQGKAAGTGSFINATSGSELTAAFKNAITSIAESKSRSFSSPTYSIDTSTLLNHGEYVYVPVFDQDSAGWPGNLKKYKLVNGVLTDADNTPAIDADGALIDTARDFWSAAASVDAVISGGAANKLLAPDSRKVYTDVGLSTFPANLSANELKIINTNVDKASLGDALMADSYRDGLISYIRGENSDGTQRNFMGDIIHSKAVQLQMSNGRKLIFVGSNEGYLHAFNDYADVTDTKNGTEAFAFMPGELLKNIKKQYTGDSSDGHIYGVDSPLTVWIDETGSTDAVNIGNGILDAGDKAYLFFGLRRGGKSYYALEVTYPDSPQLVWKIDPTTTGFDTLANTWSQPVMAMLKWDDNQDNPEPALIFGGGYSEDASDIEVPDEGNAVYIVNVLDSAYTAKKAGDLIWSTKTAEANSSFSPDGAVSNAIASRIRVLDVDRNGSADRLYFIDTGGSLWRVDLNASNFNAATSDDNDISKALLHKFADLSGDKRKFFEEPDVAIFRKSGKIVTAIAIGSGNRPAPLDVDAKDMFFVAYDRETLGLPTEKEVKQGDLKDADSLTASEAAKSDFKGWYKKLSNANGEKVLSTAVMYQNKVMFTTFQTAPVAANQCGPTNSSRLYIMDLQSGTEDINVQAAKGQILGTPQIIFEGLEGSGTGGACVKGDCKPKKAVKIGGVTIPLPLAAGAAGALPNSLPRVYWIDNE